MIKKSCLLLFALSPIILFSQEILINKKLPNDFRAKEIFQISGFENEEVAFLIQGNQNNISYLYDKDFTLKDTSRDTDCRRQFIPPFFLQYRKLQIWS